MKKNFTPFLLGAFLFAMSVTASAQNTAISMDGTGSYATSGTDIMPFAADFTVEGWFYIPSYQAGQHYFISEGGYGSAFTIGYDGDDPTHPILAGDGWHDTTIMSTSVLGNTGVTMPVNQWVHIAVVGASYVGTLYINGKQVAQTNDPNNAYLVTGTGSGFNFGLLYDATTNAGFIKGKIDQVRVWGVPRSAAEIRSGMYGAIDPATTNLIAYYTMNDGSGIIIKNNSTWVDSTVSPPISGDANWAGSPSWVASPIQSSSNALTFNGGTTNFPALNIPGNTDYDLSSGGTIELYANPTSLSSTPGTLITNNGGGNTRYTIQATDTKIILSNGGSSAFISYALPLNTWTHLAFVNDGAGNTAMYRNNDASPLGTMALALGSASGQPLTVGADNNTNPFLGSIDEVRLWSSQQTPTQIAAFLVTPPANNAPGLVGMFNFDQGAPDLDNTGLTTILDNTATMNDGNLANFSLTTASASNFTQHNLVPLPVNFISFTAVAQKDQSLLKWQTAQEQNSRDFLIERSVDGISYSAIGSVDAAGNTTSPSSYSFVDAAPVTGKNYYRLKETDLDNKFMYSDIRIVNFIPTDDSQKLVWFQTGDKAVEVDLKSGNNETYTVSDVSGRTIQQGQLSSGKLTISQVPGGLYFVKVITATGKQLDTRVIVK